MCGEDATSKYKCNFNIWFSTSHTEANEACLEFGAVTLLFLAFAAILKFLTFHQEPEDGSKSL